LKSITISQALVGFDLAIRARRLSEHTHLDYFSTFRKFQAWLEDDRYIRDIKPDDIRHFLDSHEGISNKTLLNYYVGLSALWSWAIQEGYVSTHVVRAVTPPKPEKRVITPFSDNDIRALLAALGTCQTYRRGASTGLHHSLPNPERNEAIIFLLLDTGIRVSELCTLSMRMLDLRNRGIQVMGKGDKERYIPFSARTGKSLFRYLTVRDQDPPYPNVFLSKDASPLNRTDVLHMLYALGKRAGVESCHPHRFRHTFAVNYLRNGGDPYTLQIILGHSSMDMVQTYLRLSKIDFDTKHRLASPVENMHL
jgi:site-specific recombinase XerD